VANSSIWILNPHDVHLWYASLALTPIQEKEYTLFLSADEIARAERFHFPEHKRRYIAARAILRNILSQYISINPKKIQFSYSPQGKPFISDQRLQFNVSHSHDMAIYGFINHSAIGVDIERISDTYHDGVAKRYFSAQEYQGLNQLPPEQRVVAFYRIWSRKEAVIKALGQGLSFPLASFSVPVEETFSMVEIEIDFQGKSYWHLENVQVHPGYQAACVTAARVNNWIYREWTQKEIQKGEGA
jgi:4'-phosphopantetheinyl transferase